MRVSCRARAHADGESQQWEEVDEAILLLIDFITNYSVPHLEEGRLVRFQFWDGLDILNLGQCTAGDRRTLDLSYDMSKFTSFCM